MVITKSKGVTPTERLLADLCEKSFLKLWSYPNPVKDDRDELCDLLAVFEDHIFIFFDRESKQFEKTETDFLVSWSRWKKKAIDSQIRTAHGAERYIRSGRKIFLDAGLNVEFPIDINIEKMIVHKFIVAHGAKEACKKSADDNVYGSLGIIYGNVGEQFQLPFIIDISKENPVHVLDSHNCPIIFSELDAISDFVSYLRAKLEAISSLDFLVYCGEEDLLAHYFLNFDEIKKKHFIGTTEGDIDGVMIGEGEWNDFLKSEIYIRKKSADKVSYLWDDIIQRTCQHTLDGTLISGSFSPLSGRSAILEMAKEPRFARRALSERIIQSIQNFPKSTQPIMRNLSFIPSFYEGKGYVFLQLKVDGVNDYENDYRPRRRAMLEIACGVTKNKFANLNTIIGIAIDAPKHSKKNSEDFILMDCNNWTDDLRKDYDKANELLGFYQSDSLTMGKIRMTEFPVIEDSAPANNRRKKIGRNEPCSCGSGKKFRKCCINST